MKKVKLWSKRLTAIALSATMALGSSLTALADTVNLDSADGGATEKEVVIDSVDDELSIAGVAKSLSAVTSSDADQAEAEVGGEYYINFEDAVEAAIEGEKLTLLKSVDNIDMIQIDGTDTEADDLHIDLNGKTIEFKADQHFLITEEGSLTITGSGKIMEEEGNANYGPIMMIGGNDPEESSGPQLHIVGNEDNPIELEGWSGLLIKQNGSTSYNVDAEMEYVNINAVTDRTGKPTGYGVGIYVNGTISAEKTEYASVPRIYLYDVNIKSTGHGIFQSGNAKIYVADSTIKGGDTGVEIRDGSISLSGTEITSTRDEFKVDHNANNGTAVYGAAFATYPHEGRKAKATIEGCTLTGYYPYFDSDDNGTGIVLEDVEMFLPETDEETSFNYDYIIPIDEGDNVTFDMKGNGVSFKTGNYFYVDGGMLTVQNGTVAEAPFDYAPIKMVGSTDSSEKYYSVVNIGPKEILDSSDPVETVLRGWAGVYLGNNYEDADYGMVLNVNSNSIIYGNNDLSGSKGAAIYVNGDVGSVTNNGPQINIVDGVMIDSTGHGIYQAGYATTSVKGDVDIYGEETGIEVRAGELMVMDGKDADGDVTSPYIIGNSKPSSSEANGNGTTTIGAGIAIAQHTTKQPITVTISGGEIAGYSPLLQVNPEGNDETAIGDVAMKVSGGFFNAINEGTEAVYSENLEGFLYGGTYSAEPKAEYVADGYFSIDAEGGYLVTNGIVIEATPDRHFVDKTGYTGLVAELIEELEENEAALNYDLQPLEDAFDISVLSEEEYAEWFSTDTRRAQIGLRYRILDVIGEDITSNGTELHAVEKIIFNVIPYMRQYTGQATPENIIYWGKDCDFDMKKAEWFTDTFDIAFPIPASYTGDTVTVKPNSYNVTTPVQTDENGEKFIIINNVTGGMSEYKIIFEDVYVEDEVPGDSNDGDSDAPIVAVPTIEILTGDSLSVFVGNPEKLEAEITDAVADIEWSTSDASIATVDAFGNLTTYKAGTVTITATIEGTEINDTIKITVEKHGLTLEVVDLLVGTSATVEVGGDYTDVVWSSADSAIATVDQNGNITAVGVGTTKISVIVNGIVELSCTVNVADMTVAGTQGNTDVNVSEEQVAQKQEAAASDAVAKIEVPENVDETAFKEEVKEVVKTEVEAVVNTVVAEVAVNTVAAQPIESLAEAAESVLKSQELEENEKALVYVNIVLEDVAVDVTTKVEEDNSVTAEAVPTKLTFKIEPFVKVFDADGNVKKDETKIENKDLNGSFNVRIPVPSAMAAKFTYATIDHKSEGYATKTYTLPIKEENGQFFVEMTLTHFSTFEVSFTNTKPYTPSSGGGSVKSKKPAPVVTGTWIQDAIGWWYRNADGTWPAAQWVELEWNGQKTWYYFNAEGYMHSGWLLDGGYWYFLHNVSDGTQGHMYTGWKQIDGKWYYFNPNVGGPQGSLLVNTVTPDGYTVDANGVWVQ